MIGVLVFPDFQLLDAAGPISVFEIASRFAGAAASTIDITRRQAARAISHPLSVSFGSAPKPRPARNTCVRSNIFIFYFVIVYESQRCSILQI